MPSLKKLTKELRQEIVSYLFPFPTLSSNLTFRLATLIFAKTRFCSHVASILKSFLKVFARTLMRLHSLTQISIFTKFDVRKILFHVIL